MSGSGVVRESSFEAVVRLAAYRLGMECHGHAGSSGHSRECRRGCGRGEAATCTRCAHTRWLPVVGGVGV